MGETRSFSPTIGEFRLETGYYMDWPAGVEALGRKRRRPGYRRAKGPYAGT